MTIANLRNAPRTTDPRAVALEVLRRLEAAWNDADGEAFGSVFAPDASFVNIRGEHIVDAAAIGAGHAGIFSTIYAGSVNRMELVRSAEISEGVVLAVSVNTLDCPSGPLAGVHRATSTIIIDTASDATGGVQVVSSHNTLVVG